MNTEGGKLTTKKNNSEIQCRPFITHLVWFKNILFLYIHTIFINLHDQWTRI